MLRPALAVLLLALPPVLPSCSTTGPTMPPTPTIEVDSFGETADGVPTHLYTLRSPSGRLEARLTDYGAILVGIDVPDPSGEKADLTCGFDDVSGYESEADQYFGATIGRYGNRIAGGRMTIDGQEYRLATNNDPNHLHGGAERSFDKVVWKAEPSAVDGNPAVRFSYTSPDGEEGYPGTLDTTVTYVLSDTALRIEFRATTDATTPVNLTHHSYWNLGGHGSGTITDHEIQIFASRYLPTDDTLIPTGQLAPVDGTPFDFTEPHTIGERLAPVAATPALGYDHNFVLDDVDGSLRRATILTDPDSGRVMEVWTTEPGIQFYVGNFLKGDTGKDGVTYPLRSALCLEPQHFPDSVHHDNFPDVLLEPGEQYRHDTEYRFPPQ